MTLKKNLGVSVLGPLTMLSFFQFNSMVLYCVPKLRLMGQKFSVREKMDISGLQVGEPLCPKPATHTLGVAPSRGEDIDSGH